MSPIKIFMLIALIGHILCCICDRIMTPNGSLSAADMNDNEKMSKLFDGMSEKRPIISILLGIIAMAMPGCGYFALAFWLYDSASIYTYIMVPTAILTFAAGIPHHVLCGTFISDLAKLKRQKP